MHLLNVLSDLLLKSDNFLREYFGNKFFFLMDEIAEMFPIFGIVSHYFG